MLVGLLIAVAVVALILVVNSAYAKRTMRKGREYTSGLVETTGVITGSQVDMLGVEGDPLATHFPSVTYKFSVDGKEYQGDTIRLLAKSYGEREDDSAAAAQTICDQYPVGRTVPVYYDARDPTTSCLERDAPAKAA